MPKLGAFSYGQHGCSDVLCCNRSIVMLWAIVCWETNNCVGRIKLGEEQPWSTNMVRLSKTVYFFKKNYAIASLSTATRLSSCISMVSQMQTFQVNHVFPDMLPKLFFRVTNKQVLRTIHTLLGQGNLMEQMKDASC